MNFRLKTGILLGILLALILVSATSTAALAGSPRIVVSVSSGRLSSGSGVSGYNFIMRGPSSLYGGEYREISVWGFNQYGNPKDIGSLSVTTSDGKTITMTRVREGYYVGYYRLTAHVPSNIVVTASGTIDSQSVSGSATIKVGKWGCIDCHGPAYDYDNYYRGVRAIDGVPPTAWMSSGCSACHAGGTLMEWMAYAGAINWPYHAIDRDALERGEPNAVLGFGTHTHNLEGHSDKQCVSCHVNYQTEGVHANVPCTSCHGSLSFSAPSGSEGNYETTAVMGGSAGSYESVQKIVKLFVVNVPQGADWLDLELSWNDPNRDFDIFAYTPGIHRKLDMIYGFDGATEYNPEILSVPVNGEYGQWLVMVVDYGNGGIGADPLDPGESIPEEVITIRSNYPIAPANIGYKSCEECHSGVPAWQDGKGLTHHYAGTGNSIECRACHANPHSSEIDDYICLNCHPTAPPGHPVVGTEYESMDYIECGACHGTDFHEMGAPLGGGSNCVGCHDISGPAFPKIDVSAFAQSVHRNLNRSAPNSTGNPLNAACWACHGDGSEPVSGHPSGYKNPRKCEDCHVVGALFGASPVYSHRYGATFGNVTQTVSNSYPVTGSCLYCHDDNHGTILNNDDPDSGSFDVDGDGQRGGSLSYYHYGRMPSLNSSNSLNCAFCHENPSQGAFWGGAEPLPDFDELPGHKSYYQRYIEAGGTPATETVWYYQDAYDPEPKQEGGYISPETFTDCADCHTNMFAGSPSFHQMNSSNTGGPHGGYDSTTNKCKVCHAVHRAEGAYYLLRADTQDDACNYCHIGGSAHSRKVVYDLAGTVYTPNGHTIGAASVIPDSSVYQWLEEVELLGYDENGNQVTATVEVRRYYERRNKMFRLARHHGQTAASENNDRTGYGRIGPLALRCMNCHQPHNAIDMIWKPYDMLNWPDSKLYYGYKLLRSSPSGSLVPTESVVVKSPYTARDAQIERIPVWPLGGTGNGVPRSLVIRVPEAATIGVANTGLPYTIWTAWKGTGYDEEKGPSVVNQFALSVWCADCHNLNIGYWEQPEGYEPMVFGFKSHSDRTHPVPYVGGGNGPGQCYSCHRNDLPAEIGTQEMPFLKNSSHKGCELCHFGTYSYYASRKAKTSSGQFGYYDFPHSGRSNEFKMLSNWTVVLTDGSLEVTTVVIGENNLDAVCKRCHPGIGVHH